MSLTILFEQALQAGRERNYAKAVEILQEVLCKTDQIPEALLYLGRSHHALGDFDRAVQALQFFLKVNPESPLGHFFLGRSYLALGLHEQAIRHLKRSTDLDASFPPSLSLLGLTLLKAGKPKAAINYFESALKIDPEQPKIFTAYLNSLLTHAIRLFYRNKYTEAAENFQFILKHREDSLVSHLYLASIYRETGDQTLSLLHFERASRLQPDDPILYLQKAVIHLTNGDSENAFDELNKAMKLLGRNTYQLSDPETLLRLMTLILFQNSRYREALGCARRVLKSSYDDADMHVIMAECYRNLGDLSKARNHYLRALEKNKRKLELNHGLAAVLWQQESFEELLQILKRIMKLKPDDDFASYYLALTLPKLKEAPEKTITILQEQIRSQGPDPYLMSALGGEYMKVDLPKLAEGWFLRTLKRVDNHKDSLSSLIAVYKVLDRPKELKKSFGSYLEHHPEDSSVRHEFSKFLFEKGFYPQAAREILKLLPREPGNRLLKKMLAVSYRKMKKYSEAIILFKELLRENPKSKDLLRAMVFCLAETDRRQSAINLLEKAGKAYKDQTYILLPLGVLYYKENKLGEAGKVFRRVVSIDPYEWKAYRNLGIVYDKTGNSDFSRKFLKKAEEIKQKSVR